MTTILKVVQIGSFLSKNNISCKVVVFEELQVDEETGLETSTDRRASRCLMPDIAIHVNIDRVVTWKGDEILDNISIDEFYLGYIKDVNTISVLSRTRATRRCVIFAHENELRAISTQLCYYQEYPLDEDDKPIPYARLLMINFNNDPEHDDEYEDYGETESDYEEELLDFLTGGDVDYDEFDGDWDNIRTDHGLD